MPPMNPLETNKKLLHIDSKNLDMGEKQHSGKKWLQKSTNSNMSKNIISIDGIGSNIKVPQYRVFVARIPGKT